MPIELESGRLLLTAEEIHRYKPAVSLLQKIDTFVQLDIPMTRDNFVKLHLTYCFLTGDMELLDEVEAIAKEEITRRKKHH